MDFLEGGSIEGPQSVFLFVCEEIRSLKDVTIYIKVSLYSDLAVSSSSPAQGEIFLTVNEVPLRPAFHYHPPIVLI